MLPHGIQGFRLAQLHAVRVPALVLWGANDTVDPVSAGRKSARALHARFELLSHAGHLSMLGAPAAITAAVDAFARRPGPKRPAPPSRRI
jgi:pimeloyl-ACP methyl ester carboxylesterase